MDDKLLKTEIHNIHTLKKGMTNRSFSFKCNDKRYIMRIPGEGTDKLIDRKEEYDVYQQVRESGEFLTNGSSAYIIHSHKE